MPEFLPRILIAGLACASIGVGVAAQTKNPVPTSTYKPIADPVASTRQAVGFAERGRCQEALPILKRNMAHLADKDLRYRAGMAAARCAMSIDDAVTAVDALAMLRRDFPNDPEVLYICTHFYSQLANRSAQALADGFPTSPQVSKLNAEALESAQKWDEAIAAYRQILAENPGLPEIHYRIASIMLDRASDAETAAEAKKELEEELKINPESAVAEFALGEIARRAGDWDVAIQHFSRTSQLDVGFVEADLALGMSLESENKFAEAIAPLGRYVKAVPEDPAGHYQMALAYSRTGNKTGADRELLAQRDALEKAKMRRAPNAPPR